MPTIRCICLRQLKRSDSGAVLVDTGKFTGRSPKDKYITMEPATQEDVDWGTVNQSITPEVFSVLEDKVKAFYNSVDEFYGAQLQQTRPALCPCDCSAAQILNVLLHAVQYWMGTVAQARHLADQFDFSDSSQNSTIS